MIRRQRIPRRPISSADKKPLAPFLRKPFYVTTRFAVVRALAKRSANVNSVERSASARLASVGVACRFWCSRWNIRPRHVRNFATAQCGDDDVCDQPAILARVLSLRSASACSVRNRSARLLTVAAAFAAALAPAGSSPFMTAESTRSAFLRAVSTVQGEPSC